MSGQILRAKEPYPAATNRCRWPKGLARCNRRVSRAHQDRAGYGDQVPRIDSPFNTLISRLDEMIGLKLRQMKPLLGLKRVPPLGPCVLRAKGESNGLQRLSLEHSALGPSAICCEHAIGAFSVNKENGGPQGAADWGRSETASGAKSPAMSRAREAEW